MRFFRPGGNLTGWRRFGFEVAIIVIGVGIALVANQWATRAVQIKETRQALDAVETDLIKLLAFASERMAIEPCRVEQVEFIAGRLKAGEGEWIPRMPDGLQAPGGPMILQTPVRTPIRNLSAESWKALLASETALYMDRGKFIELSAIFDVAVEIRDLQTQALVLKGRLAHLGMPGPMDADARRDAYALLGEYAAIEGLITVHASQMMQSLTSFDYQYDGRLPFSAPDEIDSDLFGTVNRRVYGDCVDISKFQPMADQVEAVYGVKIDLSEAESDAP